MTRRNTESAREQKVQTHSVSGELALERIVFFSDAVMAIAITLLAIDLRVPDIAASVAATELPRALSELGARFMSFLVSFFVIGIYWMSHHRYFRFIQRYDTGLIALNLLFLLFIVLMPFVASLFGQYYYLPSGMSVYAAAVAVIGLSMAALSWYASWHNRLTDPGLGARQARREFVPMLPTVALFILSIGLAFSTRACPGSRGCWWCLSRASGIEDDELPKEGPAFSSIRWIDEDLVPALLRRKGNHGQAPTHWGRANRLLCR